MDFEVVVNGPIMVVASLERINSESHSTHGPMLYIIFFTWCLLRSYISLWYNAV